MISERKKIGEVRKGDGNSQCLQAFALLLGDNRWGRVPKERKKRVIGSNRRFGRTPRSCRVREGTGFPCRREKKGRLGKAALANSQKEANLEKRSSLGRNDRLLDLRGRKKEEAPPSPGRLIGIVILLRARWEGTYLSLLTLGSGECNPSRTIA